MSGPNLTAPGYPTNCWWRSIGKWQLHPTISPGVALRTEAISSRAYFRDSQQISSTKHIYFAAELHHQQLKFKPLSNDMSTSTRDICWNSYLKDKGTELEMSGRLGNRQTGSQVYLQHRSGWGRGFCKISRSHFFHFWILVWNFCWYLMLHVNSESMNHGMGLDTAGLVDSFQSLLCDQKTNGYKWFKWYQLIVLHVTLTFASLCWLPLIIWRPIQGTLPSSANNAHGISWISHAFSMTNGMVHMFSSNQNKANSLHVFIPESVWAQGSSNSGGL